MGKQIYHAVRVIIVAGVALFWVSLEGVVTLREFFVALFQTSQLSAEMIRDLFNSHGPATGAIATLTPALLDLIFAPLLGVRHFLAEIHNLIASLFGRR